MMPDAVIPLVRSQEEVRESVASFLSSARGHVDRVKSLASDTHYWVYDAATRGFAPNKFIGFAGMTFDLYNSLIQGSTGTWFDGTRARHAVEQVTGTSYLRNQRLARALPAWHRQVTGESFSSNVDPAKWRFITLQSVANSSRRPRTTRTDSGTATIGSVPGVEVGQMFPDRKSLSQAKIHRPLMAGISGNSVTGAESIVLSGGYEDDRDLGDEILYTGQGGNDLYTRKQIADQELTRGNAALKKSCEAGVPVRVSRGWRSESPLAPDSGYRYDGLFYVQGYAPAIGRAGFRIWQFTLIKEAGQVAPSAGIPPGPAPRIETTTQRIVRSTKLSRQVKALYGDACQLCGFTVPTKDGGTYSEGAHVQPLGLPHNGPDVEANILCLCPNHHVQLDLGGLLIGPDKVARESSSGRTLGTLTWHPSHKFDETYLSYSYRKEMKTGA